MLIDAAFARTRVVLFLLAMILGLGAIAYQMIPKEATPEVPIPVIYVTTGLDGISPEDGERLLLMPLETELGTIAGLREMRSQASEGHASVTLEFEPGFDAEAALDSVRTAVDQARPDLPADAREPSVNEVNTALFPVLTVIVSGNAPERSLNRVAGDLRDTIEGVEGVLEVDIGGQRDELVEVLIDPTIFETYQITFEELISQIERNNRLIAAGTIETQAGRVVLKVPGLIENEADVRDMPVIVRDRTVVTFADVANVRRSFEDPQGFARIDGQPALALEVKKRVAANIIETVDGVRGAVDATEAGWPGSISVDYTLDISKYVHEMLGDLESNVIAAVILVMIVIVAALGLRNALLVGLAIPGAFLGGVAALWMMGYTMNVVVLFALILVVGMLVDGAIVTTELADRKLQQGEPAREAYRAAAKRMAWPIIASTATTLSVFVPLLFWGGVVGEFMKYLPITVLLTLTASLAMALIFIPVAGGLIGRRRVQSATAQAQLHAAETGDPRAMRGFAGYYIRLLERAIRRPGLTLLLAMALLLGSFAAYGKLGAGVSFFPEIEPDFAQVQVRARDDLSVHERDALVRRVEERLIVMEEIDSVIARSFADSREDPELIGTIQLELIDWDARRPAAEIAQEIREMTSDFPGIALQVRLQSMGPGTGKPVRLEMRAADAQLRAEAVETVRAQMKRLGGFTDVTDTLPLPGIEWRINVNRSEAARFGADVSLLGQAVQLLTQGVTIADFRPESADDTVDIRVRFPSGDRTLEALQGLRVPTQTGLIPITNFVSFEPAPRTGAIQRLDQRRMVAVESDVAPGLLVDERIRALRAALEEADLPEAVAWSFAGEAQDQAEAQEFLVGAFAAAIALMFLILITQFNSFRQAVIVMSAIIFSIAGVLIGLIITGRPFGIVMGGIGIIALAGIVVNNNIVLIDTYNVLRGEGAGVRDAILRTGAQRLRPVVLTSLTTALGLLPMVLGMNIDFFRRVMVFGAPSTQWWVELSSAIVGGLLVATVLTLLLTPAMLMLAHGRERAGTAESQGVQRGSQDEIPQTA